MLILPWNADSEKESNNNTMTTNYDFEMDWIDKDDFVQDFNDSRIEVNNSKFSFNRSLAKAGQ